MTDFRPDPWLVDPIESPLHAEVEVPGSKSITNRALVCAALARGATELSGALQADDTEAMVDCLSALGIPIRPGLRKNTLVVEGQGGSLPNQSATLNARMSGTTSRFILPVAALGDGPYRITGLKSLLERDFRQLDGPMRALGAVLSSPSEPGRLPIDVERLGHPTGFIRVPAGRSSQFLSAVLLAAPAFGRPLKIRPRSDARFVSKSYARMTEYVMRQFGAKVERENGAWRTLGTGYRARGFYEIEPDASAASYFFAAAAIVGGSVKVPRLGRGSLQGDRKFVHFLRRMGVTVTQERDWTTVERDPDKPLKGVTADFTDISDTAQTAAVVAVFASSPTTIKGIGFIRGKETDRIRAVVNELRRVGVSAEERRDGFVVHPGWPQPAVIQTYDDHRMAMAFSLLGLKAPGIRIADPGCVAKTFPGYWDVLDGLRDTP